MHRLPATPNHPRRLLPRQRRLHRPTIGILLVGKPSTGAHARGTQEIGSVPSEDPRRHTYPARAEEPARQQERAPTDVPLADLSISSCALAQKDRTSARSCAA